MSLDHHRLPAKLVYGATFVLLILCCCANAEETEQPPSVPAEKAAETNPDATAPSDAAADKSPSWMHGRFNAGVDSVWSDNDSDINLDQSLQFKIDPASLPRLHIRGYIWLNEDLDSDEDADSSLRDINDASGADVRVRPLYLYADIDDVWGKSTLRIGRQRIAEGAAYNRIDGVYFTQQHAKWQWYIFGGGSASIYTDQHKDLVFGGGTSFQPTSRTRIALDYYKGEDDREQDVYKRSIESLFGIDVPRRVKENVSDSLFSVSVWQTLPGNVNAFGRIQVQDGEVDQLILQAYGYIEPWDVSYDAAYRRRLNLLGDRVNDLSGYYRIMGRYGEYDNYRLAVHKPLTSKLVLSVEGEVQESHDDGMDYDNADYVRYGVVLAAQKLPKGFEAEVGAENWIVEGDEGHWVVTGEIKKRWKEFEWAIGADYEEFEDRLVLYRAPLGMIRRWANILLPGVYTGYDPLILIFDQGVVERHENIHSFYSNTKWLISETQDLLIKLTYEQDDGPDSPYWRVQAQYSIRF